MKKLNKKGFTLIELLAVIVILAIIVVVTVPSIIGSINNARLSSLHSLSKEVAEWYDTSLAQDALGLEEKKILDGVSPITDGKWHCLGVKINSISDTKTLGNLYGLSSNDIVLTGKIPSSDDNVLSKFSYGNDNYGQATFLIYNRSILNGMTCSSIAIVDGKAIVLLVAQRDGKFDTDKSQPSYALSDA